MIYCQYFRNISFLWTVSWLVSFIVCSIWSLFELLLFLISSNSVAVKKSVSRSGHSVKKGGPSRLGGGSIYKPQIMDLHEPSHLMD